jgi:hypothetical protein
MYGETVELVASSWIEPLGGVPRCWAFNMPPCFSADATWAPTAKHTAVTIVVIRLAQIMSLLLTRFELYLDYANLNIQTECRRRSEKVWMFTTSLA